jgi:hypothetical protein
VKLKLIHSQQPLMGRHVTRDDIERDVESVDSGADTPYRGKETGTATSPVELTVGQ